MPRPQFSTRILMWLTLVVAAFLGGALFEKETRRREQAAFETETMFIYPDAQRTRELLQMRKKRDSVSLSPGTQL